MLCSGCGWCLEGGWQNHPAKAGTPNAPLEKSQSGVALRFAPHCSKIVPFLLSICGQSL
jgi:hypothetical protein